MSQSPIKELSAMSLVDVGHQTELHLKIAGVTEKAKGKLVGMDPGRCLIIKPPDLANLQEPIYNGKQVVARYLWKGSVYGFHAKIVNVVTFPVSLLFTSFPTRVERYDVRKHDRIECLIPVTISTAKDTISGMITDLSAGGCRIIYKSPDLVTQRVHDEVELSFVVPSREKAFSCKASVRNIQQAETKTFLGVEFKPLPEDLEEAVIDYIVRVNTIVYL